MAALRALGAARNGVDRHSHRRRRGGDRRALRRARGARCERVARDRRPRITFGVTGAGFLAYLGARTLWSAFRIRIGGEVADEVATPRRAFITSLAATASNPMTIASWAAIFAAASTADLVGSGFTASALVGGVAVGTFVWFLTLSLALSLARRRLGERLLLVVDVVSGVALLGFAGLLAWRTVSDA
ncbi:MAG: LysE family transporter [Gaiellaceae bacterium]